MAGKAGSAVSLSECHGAKELNTDDEQVHPKDIWQAPGAVVARNTISWDKSFMVLFVVRKLIFRVLLV